MNEMENKFLEELSRIQTEKKAYWVQTKHIAHALFGLSPTKREFKSKKMKVNRLAKKLLDCGFITSTSRWKTVGKSTGKSLIKYYHNSSKKDSVYEKLKVTRRKEE